MSSAVSSDDILVRPYQRGDEQAVLDLFNEVFAEGDPDYHPRELAHWAWEFLDNPAGTQVVLGIEPNGRVVAQYACLPARVHLAGRDVCVGQGIDSLVHRDYRRGLKREGAFLKVAKYYFDHFGVPSVNAFGYGFPNEKAFRIGTTRLGYVPIAAPVQSTSRNLLLQTDDREVARDADANSAIVELARFDARADALWQRLEPSLPMAIRRTAAYLNWRYVAIPGGCYRAFALLGPDGSHRAIWVVRPDWQGPPILAVAELIVAADDVPAIARVLAHLVTIARELRQPRIELWVPPTSSIHRTVRERGFEVQPTPFNLCLKIYEPTLDPDWARANWYYSIGDCDVF